jgi:hypothetical protein
MNRDESNAAGTTLEQSRSWPLNAFFPVVLTVTYVFAEASFVRDVHILTTHNALPGNVLSVTVFQLDLLVSFFLYLFSYGELRILRLGKISFNLSAMLISLAFMSLLQCLMMERELAVAVFKVLHAITP